MAQSTAGSAIGNPTPPIRVVAAVIERQGRYLITQRRESAVLPLLWEFPGGKVETGETDEAALRREIQFRIAVDIRVGKLISFVAHKYERYNVDLHLYECQIANGEPSAVNVGDFAWVESSDFERYSFTPADEASVSQLLGL